MFLFPVGMSYLKNWRKYHSEANLPAHSSESENNEQNLNYVDKSRTDINNSASDLHFCDGSESSDSLCIQLVMKN